MVHLCTKLATCRTCPAPRKLQAVRMKPAVGVQDSTFDESADSHGDTRPGNDGNQWLMMVNAILIWVVDGGFKLKLARNIEITGEIQYQNISKPGFVQVHWGDEP